jgi:hypothetical protein
MQRAYINALLKAEDALGSPDGVLEAALPPQAVAKTLTDRSAIVNNARWAPTSFCSTP